MLWGKFVGEASVWCLLESHCMVAASILCPVGTARCGFNSIHLGCLWQAWGDPRRKPELSRTQRCSFLALSVAFVETGIQPSSHRPLSRVVWSAFLRLWNLFSNEKINFLRFDTILCKYFFENFVHHFCPLSPSLPLPQHTQCPILCVLTGVLLSKSLHCILSEGWEHCRQRTGQRRGGSQVYGLSLPGMGFLPTESACVHLDSCPPTGASATQP